METFHPKPFPNWAIPLVVLFALAALFAPVIIFGTMPYAPIFYYGLAAFALFLALLGFFINKWNTQSKLTISEEGISYESAFPLFAAFLSYSPTCRVPWADVERIKTTYGSPRKFSADWKDYSSEVREDATASAVLASRGAKPNIAICSKKGNVFLPCRMFEERDYERIVRLLERRGKK